MLRFKVLKLSIIAVTLLSSLGLSRAVTQAADEPGQPEVTKSNPPPRVIARFDQLARTQEEACRLVDTKEVKDAVQGAKDAGVLALDFDGIKTVSTRLGVIVTFRENNPACLQQLAAGVQSKPHAVLQKTWDEENLLPEHRHLAGLVSNLMKKPPKGEKVTNPQLTFYNGEAITCDYDLMDIAESDGTRIKGESPRDFEIRSKLNAAMAPTPKGHRDRIMHGSQSEYSQYIAVHREEPVITSLFKPEAPLTAFDSANKVYRLDTIEDVLNFYRCKAVRLPPEWDVETEDRSVTPPRLMRLH